MQQAVLPGDDLLDLGWSWEHGDNDIALLGDLLRATGGRGSFGGEFLDRALAPVVDCEIVSRFHEVAGHRPPHDPEPHEAYSLDHRDSFHWSVSSPCRSRGGACLGTNAEPDALLTALGSGPRRTMAAVYGTSPSSLSVAACPYLSLGGQGRLFQSGSNANEEISRPGSRAPLPAPLA